MTRLALSRLHFPVTTLGPGARIGVWFQGCSIRCPGCISLDTWAPDRGVTTVTAVQTAMAPFYTRATGLTVSGGEPFDQPDALKALLCGWRDAHSGDVLVYSGYPLEKLRPQLASFDGLIDVIVADPLRLDVAQTMPLRGSDNQRLVALTSVGRERFAAYDRPLAGHEPQLDIMFDNVDGSVFLAGIPRRGDMTRLKALLAHAGHSAVTSEDKQNFE